MYLEAIEEALHNDGGLALGYSAVKIEEQQRLSESCRESIARLRLIERSTGVGDRKPIFIVNRYHNTALHRASATVVTHPKIARSSRTDTPSIEVRVHAINLSEGKVQWCIAFG
jgi:hypothetical protein